MQIAGVRALGDSTMARKDDPYQDPTKITDKREILCSSPSCPDFKAGSYFGRWLIFRNYEDLNYTWCVIRDEVTSGRLGARGASCSTLWYDPLKNGAGPVTTGRISVYTNEEDYLIVGLRLIVLNVVQHDIKYKTFEATKKGTFARRHDLPERVSFTNIFWNEGHPYPSMSPHPWTNLKPTPSRNKYYYDPDSDWWRINVVYGSLEDQVHGKWIVQSNYDYMSEINITKLWHTLKASIENRTLPVIHMECPRTPDKEDPPEIHITTSEANRNAVGNSIIEMVKQDIEYIDLLGEKTMLKWSSNGHPPAKNEEDEEGEEFIDSVLSGEETRIKRQLAHGILVGPPGSGKSSLMDRLLRRPRKQFSPSTGVSESVVVIDVDMSHPSTFHSVSVLNSDTWNEVEYQDSVVRQIGEETTTTPAQLSAANLETDIRPFTTPTVNRPVALQVPTDITTATTEPAATIDHRKVRKIIKSVIKENGGYKKFKKFLKNSFSLYLRDTGGQLIFQEMLPLLVFGPSIFFFVFRLDKDLDSKFSVEFRRSTGETLNPGRTSWITIEEAFLQCLASVSTMDMQSKTQVKTHESLVFVIGTHKDRLEPSTLDEKVADINKSLDLLITKSGFRGLVQYAVPAHKQVMFTVDNTADDDINFMPIRSKVNTLVSKRDMFSVEYPIQYLLFSLELAGIKQNVLRLDECKTLAGKFGIDENQLNDLLEFLHMRVGIIRYFHKEGIQHIVIKETQVLFNMLTSFVIQGFSGDALTPKEDDDFRQMGIFTESLFDEIVRSKDAILTPKEVLELLVHLHLIAPFKDKEEKYYFFPSILSHIPECSEELKTDIQPLLFQFKRGYCPMGLFGVLVTHLMNYNTTHPDTCAITSITLVKSKVFKNQVSFEIQSPGVLEEITLKVHSSHLEVKLFPEYSQDCSRTLSACAAVRVILEDCIERAIEDLHYSKSRVEFQLCLQCEGCSELHEVDQANIQASDLRLHCQTRRTAYSVSPKGACWFIKDTQLVRHAQSSATVRHLKTPLDYQDSTISSTREVNPYLKKLDTVKLYELGGELGLNIAELRRIPTEQLPVVLCERWLREDDDVLRTSGTPTWQSLVKALRKISLNGVANCIEQEKLK